MANPMSRAQIIISEPRVDRNPSRANSSGLSRLRNGNQGLPDSMLLP
jgi:hypothetical protein